MGMYDIILVKFKCPNCKFKGNHEFQTKEGENILHVYHVGDKFQMSDYEKKRRLMMQPEKGASDFIGLIGSCEKCKVWFRSFAEINKKMILTKVVVHSYEVKLVDEIEIGLKKVK